MEQAVLAAECGCMYISPFVYQLKAVFNQSYDDGGANLAPCVDAQQYYKHFSYPTRVKAAALLSVDEAKQLVGVASITIAPDLLRTLASTHAEEGDVDKLSLFAKDKHPEGGKPERRTYVEDEVAWKKALAKAYDGKGLRNTEEAIDAFRDYQTKGEQLILKRRSS
ncbi:MAG: hypothetical protein Q9184_006861 [Pyrenodesmia sp. 2 TL-2023]